MMTTKQNDPNLLAVENAALVYLIAKDSIIVNKIKQVKDEEAMTVYFTDSIVGTYVGISCHNDGDITVLYASRDPKIGIKGYVISIYEIPQEILKIKEFLEI